MQKYFNVSFIICVLFKILMFNRMPDQVASHFSGTQANGWMDKTVDFWVWIFLCVFLFALFHLIVYLIRIMPAQYINVPNKEYWTRPENYERFINVTKSALYEIGTALFVFLTAISWLVTKANLADPVALNLNLFILFLVLFIGYLFFIIYHRLFKPTLKKK